MSGSKRTSQLTVTTTLSGNDRVVVLTNPASSAQTQTTTLTSLTNNLRYANTTISGVIKVGNNLTINATGFLSVSNVNVGIGDFVFNNTTISTSSNNADITITPLGNGQIFLEKAVFQKFDGTANAIWFRDANTVSKYGGIGNTSIYLDIASILNDSGDYVISGDGRFKYFANDAVAVQNTNYGHIILRTENNDKFIKVHNVTDNVGLELRTDNHSIQLVPNNYMWEFTPQGYFNLPTGGALGFEGMGWTGLSSGTSETPVSVVYKTNTNFWQSALTVTGGNDVDGEGTVSLYTYNANTSSNYQWTFSNGDITLPSGGNIVRDGISVINNGTKWIKVIDTTTPYTVAANDEVIICDPNAAGGNITINFPNTNTEGKLFTVKNINDGGHDCYVKISDLSSRLEIPGTGTLNSNNNLDASGKYATWIYCNGVYRCIGSGT